MSAYEITAFIDSDRGRIPFVLRISDPVESSDGGDWYCTIHAPALFERDSDIYGVNAKQAKELAVSFVRKMLGDKQLYDKEGKVIKLAL